MKDNFLEQLRQLNELVVLAKGKGYRKKDLATQLGLHASAFSALHLHIIPKVLRLTATQSNPNRNTISSIFDEINNLSEKRIRRELPAYLEQLQQLVSTEKNQTSKRTTHFIDGLIEQSPKNVIQKLEGMYFCYYVSTFGYKVKREPLLIRQMPNSDLVYVQKGNPLSYSTLKGVTYLSNPCIFTIQIQEEGLLNKDHFIAHFILPPIYEGHLDLVKGISISVANSFCPVSRKVILKKHSSSTDHRAFDQLSTTFLQANELEDTTDLAIFNYLTSTDSLMEYIPIPRPTFSVADLDLERDIQAMID